MRCAEADGDIMEIILRKARPEDREKAIEVESKATPNLSYVGAVFDMFVSDEVGEFSVAEADGEVVAIGKFTVVPDGSAWLETLRVIPERQGHGIGKRFYDRFYEVAEGRNVPTMRMYTGVKNVVSKGLAERYGFHLAQTFRGAWMPPAQRKHGSPGTFMRVTDPERATELLMTYCKAWGGYLVMNRTFYTLTPALCAYLAEEGMVYEEPESGSVVALGARFMPEKELHIGLFGGDAETCLEFAAQEGEERGVECLSCLFPMSAAVIQGFLTRYGFQLLPSDFIVMEAHLEK
jgi:ribosomal protein S18 acetylase RimI-like enzyme